MGFTSASTILAEIGNFKDFKAGENWRLIADQRLQSINRRES